jgi:hypothetical protein
MNMDKEHPKVHKVGSNWESGVLPGKLQNQQKLLHNWYSFIAWPAFFRAIAGKI